MDSYPHGVDLLPESPDDSADLLTLSRRDVLLTVPLLALYGHGTGWAPHGTPASGTLTEPLHERFVVPNGYLEWLTDDQSASFVRHLRGVTSATLGSVGVRGFLARPDLGADHPTLLELVVLNGAVVDDRTVRESLASWLANANPGASVNARGSGRWLITHPDGSVDGVRLVHIGGSTVLFVAHADDDAPRVVLGAVDRYVEELQRAA